MAKIFTDIELDRPRKMRFGYKVIKELDTHNKKKSEMTDLEGLEYMIYLALKEDDPDLKQEQIEDILNDGDINDIRDKLAETIARDMPGLVEMSTDEKNV